MLARCLFATLEQRRVRSAIRGIAEDIIRDGGADRLGGYGIGGGTGSCGLTMQLRSMNGVDPFTFGSTNSTIGPLLAESTR